MRVVNKMVKNIFRSVGLHLTKMEDWPLSSLIHHQIDLLLDVGANVGQYAISERTEGYKGKIVSFEPLPSAYETLLKRSKNDPLWTIHPRCAVGSKSGEAEINISKNSVSSSLLPMLQAHSSAAPASVYIEKAKTDVITLDSVFDSYRTKNEKTFVKIDTQGFEAQVLNGLSQNLQNVFAIQLELSIVPLYASQELYQHFFAFCEENGFSLWSLLPCFYDASTGQLLQFDATFVRTQ
jgi:FkbM family methyltransferase